MKVRPLNDHVLVKRLPMPPESKVISTTEPVLTESFRGVVEAVGPGKRGKHGLRIPLEVREGDVVRFGQYTDLDLGEYVLIQEADIRFVESGSPNRGDGIRFVEGASYVEKSA